MLSINGPSTMLCDRLARREWLRVAGLCLGGLSLDTLLSRRNAVALDPLSGKDLSKAKNCIVLFLSGGPPQHETWDPKPDASADIRGEFNAIASSVPGLHVGELMPQLAAQARHWAVLRAMQTKDNAHSASGYYMLTGQPHQPRNQENSTSKTPNLWPSVGAVVNRLRPALGAFPAAITLPEHLWNTGMISWPGQDAGFLGRVWDPWLIKCDPNEIGFQISGLTAPPSIGPARRDDRLSLLSQFNKRFDDRANVPEYRTHDIWRQKAVDLLGHAASARAFDLDRESTRTRDRYGRHRFGQSVLLARRLIESGVSLVQVNWTRAKNNNDSSPMWDTHQNHAHYLKTDLMPPMDQACSALVEDLAERGLLEETLVVWMGEFGRTPKINPQGGRDHWGDVFSVALAGGGVRGGVVHGASDAQGAQPKDGIVRPEDLLATVFHCLGMRPDDKIIDPNGRPVAISRGEIIREIL
jgi:Protein of unknown function (DUF1501)